MKRPCIPLTLSSTLWLALLVAGCGGPADEPAPGPAQAAPQDQVLTDPAPLHPLPPAPGEVRPSPVPIVPMPAEGD